MPKASGSGALQRGQRVGIINQMMGAAFQHGLRRLLGYRRDAVKPAFTRVTSAGCAKATSTT